MKKIKILKEKEDDKQVTSLIDKSIKDIESDYKILSLQNIYGKNTKNIFDNFFIIHNSMQKDIKIKSNIDVILINEICNFVHPIIAKDKDNFKIKINIYNTTEGVFSVVKNMQKKWKKILVPNKGDHFIKGIYINDIIKNNVSIFDYKYFRHYKSIEMLNSGLIPHYLYKNIFLPTINKLETNVIKNGLKLLDLNNNIFAFKNLDSIKKSKKITEIILKYVYTTKNFYRNNYLSVFNIYFTPRYKNIFKYDIKLNYANNIKNRLKKLTKSTINNKSIKKIIEKYNKYFSHNIYNYDELSLLIYLYNNNVQGINHIYDYDPNNSIIDTKIKYLKLLIDNKKSLFLEYKNKTKKDCELSIKNRIIRTVLKKNTNYLKLENMKDIKFIDEEYEKFKQQKPKKINKDEQNIIKNYMNSVNIENIELIEKYIKIIVSYTKFKNIEKLINDSYFVKNKDGTNIMCTHYLEQGNLLINNNNHTIIKEIMLKKYSDFENKYSNDNKNNDYYCKYCGKLMYHAIISGNNFSRISDNSLYKYMDNNIYSIITSKIYKIINTYINFKININNDYIVKKIINHIKNSFNQYLELIENVKEEYISVKKAKIQIHLSMYIHSCIILFIINDFGKIFNYKNMYNHNNFKNINLNNKKTLYNLIFKYLKFTMKIIKEEEKYNIMISNIKQNDLDTSYATIFKILNTSSIKLLTKSIHKVRKKELSENDLEKRYKKKICLLIAMQNKKENIDLQSYINMQKNCNNIIKNDNDIYSKIKNKKIPNLKLLTSTYNFFKNYIGNKDYNFDTINNNEIEKNINKDIKMRNFKPFYKFNWLPSIFNYEKYSHETFKIEDIYFIKEGNTQVDKYKFNIYIYKLSGGKELILTNDKMISLLEKNEKLSFKKNQFIDLMCSKSGVRLSKIKYGTDISTKIINILNKKDNINNFYKYYENRCPIDNFHTYDKNHICTKCKVNFKNISIDHNLEYYNKYNKKFIEENKKNKSINVYDYDNVKDIYEINTYVTGKKFEKNMFEENVLINFSKKVNINHNQILNLGISYEEHYDNIANGIKNPHKNIPFENQELRKKNLLEYIYYVLNFISQIHKFKNFGSNIKYNNFINLILKENNLTINDIILSGDIHNFNRNFYEKNKYLKLELKDKDYIIFLLMEFIYILNSLNDFYKKNNMKGENHVIKNLINYIIQQEEFKEKIKVNITDKNELYSFNIDDDDYEDNEIRQTFKTIDTDEVYNIEELDITQDNNYDDDDNINATIAEL